MAKLVCVSMSRSTFASSVSQAAGEAGTTGGKSSGGMPDQLVRHARTAEAHGGVLTHLERAAAAPEAP